MSHESGSLSGVASRRCRRFIPRGGVVGRAVTLQRLRRNARRSISGPGLGTRRRSSIPSSTP